MKNILLLLSFTFSASLLCQATKPHCADIFKSLAIPDSLTGAKVTVIQDSIIGNSMLNRETKTIRAGHIRGYRIQVFSSNAHRTAKSEAFNLGKKIRNAFPTVGVYVSYISPFWKVRVGNFKTSEEALDFRQKIIEVFPSLKNNTYPVREKINL